MKTTITKLTLAGLLALLGFGLMSFHVRGDLWIGITPSGTNVVLTWSNSFASLEQSLTITGAWTTVEGVVSPYVVPVTNEASFYRLRLPTGGPFDFRYLAPTFTTDIGDPSGGCGCTSPENPNSLAAGGNAQDNGLGSVFLHTGELTQHAVDLAIPGRGIDWKLERRYRSGMQYDGPLGHGWEFNYNQRLVAQPNGDVLRADGLGRVDRFVFTGGAYEAPSGFYARLVRNPDGTFDERDRHGTVDTYSATNTLGIARLTRTRDRNGNEMNFGHNALGQLTNVVDTLGRSIAYAYDGNGRLAQVTGFTGRTLQFGYDTDGNLTTVTSPVVTGTPNGNDFPLGKTTRYTYSGGSGDARLNHNLLTVTAPNEVAASGPPRLVAQYDTNPASTNADRVLSLTQGGTNASGVGAGGTITYAYASLGSVPSNDVATAVFQTIVTNRNGNLTEYHFNQLGNAVRQIQFTRGLRPGEPPGFTNEFVYNRDGETTRRVFPEGNSVEYTYDSANPDRFQQGNLLQVRRLPGPRGGDQTQLVTSTSFETNFNFLVTSTDARGNTTTHSYDERANRTNTMHRIPGITEAWEYNAFGQVTAHVLPDNGSGSRRRDVLTYYSSGPQSGYLQSQTVDSGGFNLTTTYQYDAVGNLIRRVDPRTNDTLYTVNALNQVVREQSPFVDIINLPVRYQRDYFYDANDNLVRSDVENRDETGLLDLANPAFSTTHGYDILDDRLSTTQEVDAASSIVTASAYDANQNRSLTRFGEATAGRDPFNTMQTLRDERDLVFRVIRGPGSPGQSTAQTDYDGNGNPVRTAHGTEDGGGHATTNAYDGFDRRASSTDSMGNVTTSHYDSNGNVLSDRVDGELTDVPGSAANVRLSETTYTYDAMDRRIRQDVAHFDTATQVPIGDGQSTTTTVYADNSQVTSVTTDLPGHTTTYTYDTANRRLRVTDAKGNTVTYTYDPNSNVMATTEVDKSDLNPGPGDQTFTTTNMYDNLDRPTSTTDNVGNLNQHFYDSRNNRVLYTDARGNRTRYEYDGLNCLIRTSRDMNNNAVFTDPEDIITSQTWDDSSRLTGQTDDNAYTTAYSYDSLDRRVMTDYADCTTDSTSCDVHDNPVTTTDANGSVVTKTYDPKDRLTNQTIAPGPGVSSDTTFENYQYDGLSRLIRAEDNDSIITRAYDSLSNVTRETQRIAGGPARTITATHDSERNQTRLVYPGGRTIVRTYDLLDRPSLIRDDPPGPGTTIATYRYIGPYRVERRDYGGPSVTRYAPTYDGIRRIINTRHTLVSSGVPFENRQYAWDPVHNKLVMDNLVAPLPPDLHNYASDAANRLIFSAHATPPPTDPPTTYVLDGVGNRLSVGGPVDPGPYTMDPTLCEPGDYQMNQYTTTPFNPSQLHDQNGNLADVNAGGLLLKYDYRNRLVQFFRSDIIQTTTYRYDCLGRRIEKIVAGAVTRFYYDASELIEEQNAANATVATHVYSKSILHAPPRSAVVRPAPANQPVVTSWVKHRKWGQLVPGLNAVIGVAGYDGWGRHTRLQMARGGQKYFYHEDDLGSVMKVTDSLGNVVEGYDYHEYGKPAFFDQLGNPIPQSGIGNPFLFHGHYFDTESGRYWCGDRYLATGSGRYISRMAGGPSASTLNLGNAYMFSADNPVSYSSAGSICPHCGSAGGARFWDPQVVRSFGAPIQDPKPFDFGPDPFGVNILGPLTTADGWQYRPHAETDFGPDPFGVNILGPLTTADGWQYRPRGETDFGPDQFGVNILGPLTTADGWQYRPRGGTDFGPDPFGVNILGPLTTADGWQYRPRGETDFGPDPFGVNILGPLTTADGWQHRPRERVSPHF